MRINIQMLFKVSGLAVALLMFQNCDKVDFKSDSKAGSSMASRASGSASASGSLSGIGIAQPLPGASLSSSSTSLILHRVAYMQIQSGNISWISNSISCSSRGLVALASTGRCAVDATNSAPSLNTNWFTSNTQGCNLSVPSSFSGTIRVTASVECALNGTQVTPGRYVYCTPTNGAEIPESDLALCSEIDN